VSTFIALGIVGWVLVAWCPGMAPVSHRRVATRVMVHLIPCYEAIMVFATSTAMF
jgi:hypothetical protein